MLCIKMVRDKNEYPHPHEADVHPDEVGNYAQAGFVVFEKSGQETSDGQSSEADTKRREAIATQSNEGPRSAAKEVAKAKSNAAKWGQPPKA